MKPYSLALIPLACAAMVPLAAGGKNYQQVSNPKKQANNKTVAVNTKDASAKEAPAKEATPAKKTATSKKLFGNKKTADMSNSNNSNSNASDESMKNMDNTSYDRMDYTITPQADPVTTNCCDFFVTGEFIWWRAQEDNLNFAFSGVSPTSGVSASRGTVYHPKFKYEPGFKVGVGLKFRHDGWDLYANYTWLRSNNQKKHFSTGTGSNAVLNTFEPFAGPAVGVTAPFVSSAHANWNMHFNVLDGELGRNFYISRYLTLRPHFGLKFAWIQQHLNVNYSVSTDEPDFVLLGGSGRDKYKVHDFGVGIRTGLDTSWYFVRHWSIFGDFAFSALINNFKSDRKDTFSSTFVPENTNFNAKVHNDHAVTGVLELGLGLRFDTTFHDDDLLFFLQAGWEEQIWFDYNRFFFAEGVPPSNMTLEGLTVKTGIYF